MRKRKSSENAVDRLGGEGKKAEILNQQFKPGDLTWVEIHNSSWWPAQILDDGSVSAKPRKKSKNELLVRLYGTYEYMYVDASKSNSVFEDVLKRENKTMKEMFQEALEQDMSLMLPKGQSKLESSKPEGIDSAETSKDKKKQPELTKEPSAVEADEIATAMKICTNKEKKEGSSKRKRKLDFSKEERENKETEPKASKAEAPNIKKKKGHDEAQKRSTLNSKHVEKKNAKGNSKAKSPELKAETPPEVKDTAPPGEEKGSLSERQVRVMQSLGLIAPAGSPFRRNGFII
ncbi:uncharacterized protein LOC144552858 isoform X2 [Carex rostrata]